MRVASRLGITFAIWLGFVVVVFVIQLATGLPYTESGASAGTLLLTGHCRRSRRRPRARSGRVFSAGGARPCSTGGRTHRGIHDSRTDVTPVTTTTFNPADHRQISGPSRPPLTGA
jgi:hypothetical protein